MLRHPKIRSIHFSQMDTVTSFKQRVEKVKDETTSANCQEAFDIFKDKSGGRYFAMSRANTATSVFRWSLSRRAPADEKPWHGGPPMITSLAGSSKSSLIETCFTWAQVLPVSCYRTIPVVVRYNRFEASANKAECHSACTTEQINKLRFLIHGPDYNDSRYDVSSRRTL